MDFAVQPGLCVPPFTRPHNLIGADGTLNGAFMLKKLVIVVAILALIGGIAGASEL